MSSNIIGKKVTITDNLSVFFKDWGIVKDFDGEYYHIAIFNDSYVMPIFTRDEFKIDKS